MRTPILSISFLFLLSCSGPKNRQTFPELDNKAIQDISKTVISKICSDSSLQLSPPLLFADTLTRRHLALRPDSIQLRDLLNCVISDQRWLDTIPFSNGDSLFLVHQEYEIENIPLAKTECIRLDHAQALEDARNNMLTKDLITLDGYFILSIPVFSLDKKTAIVSLEFRGFSIDSFYEQIFILRQINQIWTIVKCKTIAMA